MIENHTLKNSKVDWAGVSLLNADGALLNNFGKNYHGRSVVVFCVDALKAT